MEEFEVVKRKGKANTRATEPTECLIMSEEEMREQGNRLNWRKGGSSETTDIFRAKNDRPQFPKVFENYLPYSETKKKTVFTNMKKHVFHTAEKSPSKIEGDDPKNKLLEN